MKNLKKGSQKRVLLIDADVLAYQAASACEEALEWEPGYWTWNVPWDAVVKAYEAELKNIIKTLKGDEVKLCLTDSLGNFRSKILPTYKGNRSFIKKPVVLKAFKQWLIDEKGAYFKEGLEGDDCLGILSTRPNPNNEERIIVSSDKDMKSIPGLFVRWGTQERDVLLISEDEANYNHMFQTLTGDITDGYKGLPGCGAVSAKKILGDKPGMSSQELWEAVVAAFKKAKLTEEDALVQARVARILRASDYNFKKKEVILWKPH